MAESAESASINSIAQARPRRTIRVNPCISLLHSVKFDGDIRYFDINISQLKYFVNIEMKYSNKLSGKT